MIVGAATIIAALALAPAVTAASSDSPVVCSAECANGGGNCYDGAWYPWLGGRMVCVNGEWRWLP